MANNYKWDFDPIEVLANEVAGKTDVIQTIHWRVSAVSDDETPLASTVYSSVTLELPGDDFIEFNNVTRDQVKTWVLEQIGITEDELKEKLDQQIQAQAIPQSLTKVPAGWGD